ncbi:hypothetical protein ACWOA4_08440 [Pediococcus pentosaceus]|uniref:DUF1828 domain-containing protein n=1 Tax=Pediococcus pentosaceus TaxID=1255 RepID=A0A6L5A3N1_PEDPE|nr:hypothetical protein [Pediococcus pentosaceus]KAF0349256.1 hypothetical protein GBO26_07145 [Pediococcus pentosaceus]KAF0415128.1 hypothetical protein GBO79_02065 [Pediococcus pentosaceus]KAF0501812.1 hypothetical protein GBP22_07930 [Pediococcus pentosaceus]KAF0505834.1 hypothetical protein GBP24_07545 [Pediococcus pentosaceus]MBF7105490.1 hypothetical protein [Pediococcus pentosaceus]
MKLVRISDDTILDVDDVQFAIWDDEDQKVKIEFKSTNTYLYTKDKKALDAICGSEEHLVNDASMNILKAESINSGHLNQQKYPSR